MSVENEDKLFRYLFTVRQHALESEVTLDTFFPLTFPVQFMDADIMAAQEELLGNPLKEEMKEVGAYFQTTSMRLRFNGDMYPRICMVKSEVEIDREGLEAILQLHYDRGTIKQFLKDAEV
jgi:hypothetical protein